MPRSFSPKVITANDVVLGDVVYLSEADDWVRDLSAAEVLTDEAHADLRLIEAQTRQHEVVGVYFADITPTPDGPEPVHFREDFRRTGPSNYRHGKQELRAAP